MRAAWRGWGVGVVLGWAGLSTGCGSPPPSTAEQAVAPQPIDTSTPAAELGGQVVATVEGRPITIAEVQELARRAHLEPTLALRRLEEEAVLGALAERSSAAHDPEVDAAARRASVRALLARVIEPSATPETISAEDVEARRREIASGLSMPETRRAAHVLVSVPPDADTARLDAATRLARSIRDELAASSDPVAAMDAYEGRRGAFDVVVEHLDPTARADLEAPFADALFAAAAPGLLPDVVRTSYGVHVVDLVEIVPSWEVPREEWEPAIRRQIAAERRARALEELATSLAARTPVHIEPSAEALVESAALDTSAMDSRGGS